MNNKEQIREELKKYDGKKLDVIIHNPKFGTVVKRNMDCKAGVIYFSLRTKETYMPIIYGDIKRINQLDNDVIYLSGETEIELIEQ